MTDDLLVETVERLLADTCTLPVVRQAETDRWAPSVWTAVAEMGLPWISVPEESGGSGGELADALAVLKVAGAYAAPVPLAETGVLAGWLAAGAGLPLPEGPVTVVPGSADDTLVLAGDRLQGRAHRVPWAAASDRVVALLDDGGRPMVASIPTSQVVVEPGTNLAGEPRDTVSFPDVVCADLAPAAPGVDAEAFRDRGALTRVMLSAGAIGRISELTLGYTSERQQFGVPVGKFQAVQAHLVQLAQDAAEVSIAADLAARAAERGRARFEIAAAKLLASRGSISATRAAHQAHGAIGMTQEYELQLMTRRLWSWRSEYGDERAWSRVLGSFVARAGADELYPCITAGSRLLDSD
jgi:acyl-CoA dehydrogenase